MEMIPCPYCAGTGEGYRIGMQGDGWAGVPCDMCEGWGQLVKSGEATYPLGPHAATYRDEQGKFRSLKGIKWIK